MRYNKIRFLDMRRFASFSLNILHFANGWNAISSVSNESTHQSTQRTTSPNLSHKSSSTGMQTSSSDMSHLNTPLYAHMQLPCTVTVMRISTNLCRILSQPPQLLLLHGYGPLLMKTSEATHVYTSCGMLSPISHYVTDCRGVLVYM